VIEEGKRKFRRSRRSRGGEGVVLVRKGGVSAGREKRIDTQAHEGGKKIWPSGGGSENSPVFPREEGRKKDKTTSSPNGRKKRIFLPKGLDA